MKLFADVLSCFEQNHFVKMPFLKKLKLPIGRPDNYFSTSMKFMSMLKFPKDYI